MTQQRYTDAKRTRILNYAAKHGVPEASDKYGVSQATVYTWRKRDNGSAPEDAQFMELYTENAELRDENEKLKNYIVANIVLA